MTPCVFQPTGIMEFRSCSCWVSGWAKGCRTTHCSGSDSWCLSAPVLAEAEVVGLGDLHSKASSMSQGHCLSDWTTGLSQRWKLGSSLRDWCNQTREFSFPWKWMMLLVPPLPSLLSLLPLRPVTTAYQRPGTVSGFHTPPPVVPTQALRNKRCQLSSLHMRKLRFRNLTYSFPSCMDWSGK